MGRVIVPATKLSSSVAQTRAEMPSPRIVRSNLPMKLMGRRKGMST